MLIKRILLLVGILCLNLTVPAMAAEPASGTIEGQIINGTDGGSSVADQEVILKTYLNDAEDDSTTTRANTDGHFVFSGLPTEASYRYEVVITYQQAEYYSGWLIFDDGETTKSTEITVYDSTTSDEAISVEIAHTIVYVEEDSLLITEYFLFVNAADRSYIGAEELATGGTRETLHFYLPEDATELQLGAGLMDCCVYGTEDGFIDSMPVLPGGKEIVYAYRVFNSSRGYTFSRYVNYPIANYDFLVQGEGSKISSDRLIEKEPMDISGTLFSHLAGTAFTPGDTIEARISSPPDSGSWGTVLWVALTLLVLVLTFGSVYLVKKRKLQPVSTVSSPEQHRQRLLVELARLDDAFASNQISEGEYSRLRAEKKTQLVTLIQKAREKSDSG
jgi:hypothetical protein